MLKIRRYTLFPLVCLISIGVFAVPIVHQLSYGLNLGNEGWLPVHANTSDHHHHDVLHIESDCATCDLISTLSTLHVEASPLPLLSLSEKAPPFLHNAPLLIHYTSLCARAPPETT